MAARLLVGALRVSEYVDADVFARTLPRSEATAVTAGRAVLRRLDELTMARRSFGFEATLARRETLVANDGALWRRIRAEAGHEG
jgi:predicted ABC-type ATPase